MCRVDTLIYLIASTDVAKEGENASAALFVAKYYMYRIPPTCNSGKAWTYTRVSHGTYLYCIRVVCYRSTTAHNLCRASLSRLTDPLAAIP